MEKQDLRYGNIVRDIESERVGTVITIGKRTASVKLEFSTLTQSFDEYEPVELTEDYLFRLGFEKRDDQKYYHTKFDRTWVSLDSILVKWYGNALGGIMMLDYVHQLQNIFFAINHEELNLN